MNPFTAAGLSDRTPRGRCATQLAYKHLNMDFIGRQSFDIDFYKNGEEEWAIIWNPAV